MFNETQPCAFENSRASMVFMISALIIGILGNTSLVIISLANRDMRTPPNLMIVNLALGDLMFLIVIVPVNLAYNHECSLIMSTHMCKLYIGITFLVQGVSVYTFTALSLDRYQAIARPLRWRRGGTSNNHPKLRAFLTVILIWAISFSFAAPSIKMADIYPYDSVCHLPYTSFATRIYFPIFFVGSYCVPLIAVFVFYSMTAGTLLHGLRYFNQNHQTAPDRRHKSRVRLAIIILIAALSFAVCWLPHHVFTLWFEFCEDPHRIFERSGIEILFAMQQLLPLFSCCLNPLLLYAMSSNYRRKIRIILRHLCGCNSGLLNAKEPLFRARNWTLVSLRTTSLTRGSPTLQKRAGNQQGSLNSNETNNEYRYTRPSERHRQNNMARMLLD
ncbi:putative neuromedin-B receptor-like [Apostichopus japonicus]|uniref:Putative neuromedin-B receptor-like n=1 Tax=Stichopus japonicus TaxID=307972 RepID=A0A2G8KX35_STIJA|nr:putative neuromedin-B receptor-like [Apostichopus japonicus]